MRGYISDVNVDGCIKSVKIYKNFEKLYNKKSWLFMTRKIGIRFFKFFEIFIYF